METLKRSGATYVTEESAVLAQVKAHKQGYREGWEACDKMITKQLIDIAAALKDDLKKKSSKPSLV